MNRENVRYRIATPLRGIWRDLTGMNDRLHDGVVRATTVNIIHNVDIRMQKIIFVEHEEKRRGRSAPPA